MTGHTDHTLGATDPGGDPANDPRPVAPEAPLPTDCCESGCAVCVHDLYADELADYRSRLAAWNARHVPG